MKNFFTTWGGVLATLVLFVVMLSPVLVGADGTGSPAGRTATLDNPLGGINSVCQLVTKLLQAAIVIGIPIAVLFIVWAGFKFILALGKPDKLKGARENFLNVIIGIAIFLGASLIAQVIMNTLKGLGVQGINSC